MPKSKFKLEMQRYKEYLKTISKNTEIPYSEDSPIMTLNSPRLKCMFELFQPKLALIYLKIYLNVLKVLA